MDFLLRLSRGIDWLNEHVGKTVYWLILIMVIICTGNALMRKLFNISSNGFLEIQWYLFAAVFLLGAAYTLQRNEHVRIDVVVGRFSLRTQIIIDILGTLLFLTPLCLLMIVFGWPYFLDSWHTQEYSPNPGGLILWPVKVLIPIGFVLLQLQGLSQLIKEIGALTGHVDPHTLVKSHHGHAPADVPAPHTPN